MVQDINNIQRVDMSMKEREKLRERKINEKRNLEVLYE